MAASLNYKKFILKMEPVYFPEMLCLSTTIHGLTSHKTITLFAIIFVEAWNCEECLLGYNAI
jgi:hypothetical protein